MAGMKRRQDIFDNKEKENGWPHHPTAERKRCSYSNVLGDRIWQTKERQVEKDTKKYIQRRPGRHEWQLAWSPAGSPVPDPAGFMPLAETDGRDNNPTSE